MCTQCNQFLLTHSIRVDYVVCFHCDAIFRKKKSLEAHLKTHADDADPVVVLAEDAHLRTEDASGDDDCGGGAANVLIRETAASFLCFVCQKTFQDPKKYLSHMHTCCVSSANLLAQALRKFEQKNDDEMLVCVSCNELVFSKPRINEHVACVHAGNAYECDNPKQRFYCRLCNSDVEKNMVVFHFKTHFFASFQKCQFCATVADKAHVLWHHMFTMHPARSPLCPLCGTVSVRNNRELVQHLLHCHGLVMRVILLRRKTNLVFKEMARVYIDGVEKFRCLECPSVVNSYSSLKRHMTYAHCDETPYVCDKCSKAFKTKNKLVIHYNSVHERVRSYNCELCGRGFAISSNLTKHLRIHTGEKPYVCDLCGVAFSQSSSLYSHKVTHAQNACYECSFCGKGFLRPWQLKKHEATIHLGKHLPRTRVCDECGKAFRTNHELKRHKETHTSIRSYVCEFCDAGFTVRKYLLQHYKTHVKS